MMDTLSSLFRWSSLTALLFAVLSSASQGRIERSANLDLPKVNGGHQTGSYHGDFRQLLGVGGMFLQEDVGFSSIGRMRRRQECSIGYGTRFLVTKV